MMKGSSPHSQDLALDALDALDLDEGSERDDNNIPTSVNTNGHDLTAAIDAALSGEDDADNDDRNDGDALDSQLLDEMADFSLHSKDDPDEKKVIDEAMDLLNDNKVSSAASLNDSDSKNKKFNDDATQSSMASFSSVDFTTDENLDNSERGEGDPRNGNGKNGNHPAGDVAETVPIQQFENALALIQDLERQVDTLEAVKHQLQFENEELRQKN